MSIFDVVFFVEIYFGGRNLETVKHHEGGVPIKPLKRILQK